MMETLRPTRRRGAAVRRFFRLFDLTHAAVLVFIFGTLITLLSFLAIRRSENIKLEAEFGRLTTGTSHAISKSIETHTEYLVAIRSFYYATDAVSRRAFFEFTRPLIDRSRGIQALEWVPWVRDAERPLYVASARSDGHPQFDFTEQGDGDVLIPSPPREEYFPVYFVEPLEGNERALGFDLASDPIRRRALEEARDQGEAVATARVHLVQTMDESYGFLIFLPVYDEPLLATTVDQRRRFFRGFVSGVFELSEILRTARSYFSAEGIDIRLEDRSAPEGEQFLTGWNSGARVFTTPGSMFDLAGFSPDLHREIPIEVGRRNWSVVCTATPLFFEQQQAVASLVVLLSGIGFSILLMFYLFRLADGAGKLRESESRYRSMVDFSPDAVVIFDVDANRFVDVNGKAAELFGMEKEELLRHGPIDLSPKTQPDGSDSSEWSFQMIRLALAGGSPGFEWVHIKADGTLFPCEVRLHRVPAAGRKLVCGSITDTTDRKRQENDRLVLERKLQDSQRLESLELLCGGVAHDFNNLLTPILGRAGLALDEIPANSPVRRHIEDIELSAQRAGELIRLFLAYTGHANLVITRVPINPMIAETGQLLSSTRPDGVRLELALSQDDPVTEGDSGQIRQIIMNLITNATDAIGPNPGTISLASGEIDADREYLSRFVGNPDLAEGRYVWLEVSDTGHGMDEETIARVFDPFFTTKEKGRGLGLASTLGIAKSHGGAVHVRSKPGQGTTFQVIFPIADPAVAVPESGQEPLERVSGTGLALIADDEISVRSLVGTLLKKVGFTTVEAVDGIEAVEVFRRHADSVQVVILDLTMPKLGGVEVYGKIREIRPAVPVVFMSGYSEKLTASQVDGLEFSGFIQKPFKPEQFVEIVQNLIKP